MLWRAKLAVVVSVLAALLVLPAGAGSAWAHGAHSHAVSQPPRAGAEGPAAGTVAEAMSLAREDEAGAGGGRTLPHRSGELASAPDTPNAPVHTGACCCGGILCHGGVATMAVPAAALPDSRRGRPELPVVLAVSRDVKSGIERPPRRALPV